MVSGFIWTLASVLLPALVSALGSSSFRRRMGFALPLTIGLQLGFLALLSALSRSLPFGFAKWAVVVGVASLFTCFIERRVEYRRKKLSAPSLAAILAVLAALVIADQIYITGTQGWASDPGKIFRKHENYFRGPFNTDAERNVVVTNALLRRQGPPFLPKTEWSYQLYWFHIAALICGARGVSATYSQVSGATAGLAYLFAIVFLIALSWLRPTWLKRRGVFLAVALLAFSHADIIHGLSSFWRTGSLGMEADGSIPWVFFRNFSLKLTAILSPHHLLFFLFLTLFLVSPRIVSQRFARLSFGGLAVLASPIFAVFFFPWWLLSTVYKHRKFSVIAKGGMGVLVVAEILHRLSLGFSIQDLFLRQAKQQITWFPLQHLLSMGSIPWLGFPGLWPTSFGVLGLVAMGIFFLNWRTWGKVRWDEFLAVILLGNIAVYYLLSGPEIQRHFAILSSVLVILWITKRLPALRGKATNTVLVGSVLLSFVFHSYFVWSFTQKPNIVDSAIPWDDYFAMNETLRKKYPAVPVAAALAHENGGFPLAMEATTSFSVPFDVSIYSRANADYLSLLGRVEAEHLIMPYAKALGYELMLWGPVEERAWGNRVRERYVKTSPCLEQTGKVCLVRIHDYLLEEWDRNNLFAKGTSSYHESRGERLFSGSWNQEAFDEFDTAIKLNPKSTIALRRTGQIFLRANLGGNALSYFQKTISLEPHNSENYALAGAALALLEQWEAAAEAYQKSLSLAPASAESRYRLGKVWGFLGKWEEGEREMRKAIELEPTNPIYQGGLGLWYERRQLWKEAIAAYESSLKLDKEQPFIAKHLSACQLRLSNRAN